MMRLFSKPVFYELWKCGLVIASTGPKRQAIRLLPSSLSASVFSCRHRVAILRHLRTGCSLRKDVPQPKPEQPENTEKIDLDIWKSVMRSQAVADEKQGGEEEEEAGDDLPEGSTLEASRELVAMWRQAGKTVPEEMTDDQLQTLAKLTTKSSKRKYLKHLAIKEGYKKARKEKQQEKKAKRAAVLENIRDSQDDDGTERGHSMKNTFLLQFWGRSLDKLLAWRSAQAMRFGQPLVFDMSYEHSMSRREVDNTVSQLMEVEGWNRRATDPFHLHFCSLQPDGGYKRELLKRYGAEAWDRLLITATELHHADVFPRDRLVYLTADSPNVLRTFDHSKVYIIGALVDRSIQSGLSLANAKRLKLATARLPLDEFLCWETGAKNLTLDQMIRIMLTIKDTGKWEEALKFVPGRKHDGFHPQQTGRPATNHSTRQKGTTHHWQREHHERPLRQPERSFTGTFKNEDRGFSNSYKDSQGLPGPIREIRDRMGGMAGLTGARENKTAVSRVRESFKSKVEGKRSTGKSK